MTSKYTDDSKINVSKMSMCQGNIFTFYAAVPKFACNWRDKFETEIKEYKRERKGGDFATCSEHVF